MTPITPTTTTSTSLFSPTDTSEIATIWNQVRIRVLQLAGGDEKKIKHGLSIEDVLKAVEQAQVKDKKAQEKYGLVRDIFNKTLQCISHVGGIVASGASQVFGPSELAFNALTFVINAWQGYEGIFESLAGLLEKCVEFLDRLTYYAKAGMDIKLQRVACQHLQLFVEICDRTIKLRDSKRMKLKVFSKLFFLNDNDINGLLDMMSGLVDKEGHLVAAQTFNFSSEAAANSKEALLVGHRMDNKIDSLVEDKMDQKKEKDSLKRKESILRALSFEDEMMDKDKNEPNALWRSTYNNYRRLIVPGTGEWIANEPQFVSWESGDNAPPILVIEGGEGTGKSYLTSAVIRHLQSHSPQDVSGSRTSVAFYFLEGDNKDGSYTLNSLNMVSKAVVWQFTQGDVSYQKSVAGICEKVQALDPHEIWTQLLFDNKDREKIDTTFFIVIDGLEDNIDDRLITILRKASLDRRVRVFLTGNSASVEQLSNDDEVTFAKIELGADGNNESDVNKYIDLRMDQMEALKDTKREGILELREDIRSRLREETKGDYFKLDTNLSKISDLDSVNDINEVLNNAGKERSDQIIAEIDKLNKTRTTKEIQEINLIALFIISGKQWFVPSHMDQLLYLQNGETSLLSVETKIKTRYSIFAVDSDGDVAFKSTDIPTYLPVKGRLSENDIILAQSDSVQASEVTIVEHFLHTVCPPQLYAKFGFEAFFEHHRQGNKQNQICQDDHNNGNIKLVLICLRVLTEERDDKTAFLHVYSANYLTAHMESVDLALVGREGKAEVGQRLAQLFTEESCMDSLFTFEDSTDGAKRRDTWVWNEEGSIQTLRWFKDSAVVENITDEDTKSWIAKLLSGSDPDEHLLKPIVKRLAYRWLREHGDDVLVVNAFLFTWGLLNKIRHQNDKAVELLTIDPEMIYVENINEAETYAQKLLEITEKDSTWEANMASLFSGYIYTEEAEKRARIALTLDPKNWRASHLLAKSTTTEGEAIQILEGIAESFGEDEKWLEDEDNKSIFATVLYDLGEKYWTAEKYDEASKAWIKGIQQEATSYSQDQEILQKYTQKERWVDAAAFVDVLRKDGSHNLRDFGRDHAAEEQFHEVMLQIAVASSSFQLLEDFYLDAIASAIEDEEWSDVYYLRFYYGKAVNWRPERENEAVELWQKALMEDLPRSTLGKEDVLPDLIMALAPVYLRLARAAEPDSDLAKDYLVRISDWLHDDVIERNLTYPPKLYLARYYFLQKDELRAKEAARSSVKIALEMLSDDTDENDYEAYWRLNTVFIALEDDENALAAWEMLAFTQEDQPEEEEEAGEEQEGTEETEKKTDGVEKSEVDGVKAEEENVPASVIKGEDTESSDTVINSNVEQAPNGSKKKVKKPTYNKPDAAIEDESDEDEDEEDDDGDEEEDEEDGEDSEDEGSGDEDDENDENDENENQDENDETSEIDNEAADSDSESSSSTTASSTTDTNWVAKCDGHVCGIQWTHASEMYCCRDCIAYQFDPICYASIRAGTLKRRICDKNHSFLFVPKWDGETGKVEKGFVRVGERVVGVEEWKREVRARYVDFEGHVGGREMGE